MIITCERRQLVSHLLFQCQLLYFPETLAPFSFIFYLLILGPYPLVLKVSCRLRNLELLLAGLRGPQPYQRFNPGWQCTRQLPYSLTCPNFHPNFFMQHCLFFKVLPWLESREQRCCYQSPQPALFLSICNLVVYLKW